MMRSAATPPSTAAYYSGAYPRRRDGGGPGGSGDIRGAGLSGRNLVPYSLMARRVDNVVLIGMPAAGKSTIGVMFAKVAPRLFVDTDVLVQARAGCTLQAIIDREGLEAFRALEEKVILDLRCAQTVIATGGSVVYSEPAMRHLRALGYVVHLLVPWPVIEARLTDQASRGLVRAPGQSIKSLFDERLPLYRRWADLTIMCEGRTHEDIVAVLDSRCGRGTGL